MATRHDLEAMLDHRDQGWPRRDAKLLASPYADDAVLESPLSGRATGRAAIEQTYERLLSAWWPLEYSREQLLVDGDRLALSFRVQGTHSGEFFGHPPTGKTFTLRGVNIIQVEGGLFVHEWRVHDFTGLLVKLGVLKALLAY